MLETHRHDAVTEIRLARPPVNALTAELIRGLSAAVRSAPSDGARAIVLSGREGMFTAGLDLPYVLSLDEEGARELVASLFDVMRAVALSEVPVAAALTGHSPAGGTVLAIWCDHRVMARGPFRMGLNEVEVGLPLPPLLVQGMARLVGGHAAARLVTGALLPDAEEALRLGLVDELAEPTDVVDRAVTVAKRWASLPQRALREARENARAELKSLFWELTSEEERFTRAFLDEEAQSAMRAVVERLKKK